MVNKLGEVNKLHSYFQIREGLPRADPEGGVAELRPVHARRSAHALLRPQRERLQHNLRHLQERSGLLMLFIVECNCGQFTAMFTLNSSNMKAPPSLPSFQNWPAPLHRQKLRARFAFYLDKKKFAASGMTDEKRLG